MPRELPTVDFHCWITPRMRPPFKRESTSGPGEWRRISVSAGVAELADARDLKSRGVNPRESSILSPGNHLQGSTDRPCALFVLSATRHAESCAAAPPSRTSRTLRPALHLPSQGRCLSS